MVSKHCFKLLTHKVKTENSPIILQMMDVLVFSTCVCATNSLMVASVNKKNKLS